MRIFALLALVLGLCGFSELAEKNNQGLKVESNTKSWEVKSQGGASIRAFEPNAKVEIVIDLSDVLPSSPLCMSNKRIKDIKMTLDIHKVATENETNFGKSFEKTRIRFIGHGENLERKVYGSTLIKNSLKFKAGEVVNVGALQFLAPLSCEDIFNTSMRIYGMKVNGRQLPVLDFSIKSE